ncbi:restriction endonuclease [Ethanoligenens harbinense]|uniref:restriction endonuclease n=1 Tax=Ethanoligenens harbinense TaxID=253239 RepID=UPI003BF96CF9
MQAKHWNENHAVGSKEIRDFYGAMGAGDKSKRGIFVTTSFFTDDAKETSKLFFDRKMILIDRDRLLRLMIENNVGVVPKHSYVLKSVDENLFDEEEG